MEHYTEEEFRDRLLPMLECIACHCSKLELVQESLEVELPIPLHSEHILCAECGTRYPITEDLIPIMWTPQLREYLLGQHESISEVGANVEIYDAISDDYQSYSRQDPLIGLRIRNAAGNILGYDATDTDSTTSNSQVKRHLDFGCGPGHVLKWLKPLNLLQVGLDVSINNLRNARGDTGAFVVCGDATNMPFSDEIFDLVTESSALHHIKDWKTTILESCRVCRETGGVLIDSEPSKDQKAWGPVAVAVYNARFPIYRILSYVRRSKYMFRDLGQAKLNLMAEVYNQPGKGFPLEELEDMFQGGGFAVDVIVSPTPDLKSVARPDWKTIVLNLFSCRNPWNPKYGAFMAIAKPAAGEVGAPKGKVR